MSRINTVVPRNVAVPADKHLPSLQVQVAKAFAVIAISKRVVLPAESQSKRHLRK